MASEYVIEMKGITKTFGSVVANKDVDLTLRQGEILALLGENGSGKTTLMNMLSGIYQPDRGQILMDGIPVTLTPRRILSGWALVWSISTSSWWMCSPRPITSGWARRGPVSG